MITFELSGRKKMGVRLSRIILNQQEIAKFYPSVENLYVYRSDYEALQRKMVAVHEAEAGVILPLSEVGLSVGYKPLLPADDEGD